MSVIRVVPCAVRAPNVAKRLRRGAVILGVMGLAAGGAVLTAGSALAGVGSQPGNMSLSALTGALSTTPTWSTTTGCPSGFQGSAQLAEFTPAGVLASRISPTVATVTAPFSGQLDGTVGALLNTAGVSGTTPGTSEWAVGCWSGAGGTGTVQYVQSTFVSVAAGATTYTTSGTGPVLTATTTTLVAAPSPAGTGATVTLTANVSAGAAFPAGTIQFEVGGTALGTPVAVNTGGVAVAATATTTFAAAGTEALSAVFTPTSTTTYAGSTGTFSLLVQTAGSLPATGSPVPITLTITPSGTLSVSVVNTAVPLTLNTAGTQATGTLGNVTIMDSRNSYPGWSVTGQQSAFTGPTGSTPIPGDNMGWVPASVGGLVGGAVLGPTVAPGTSPGGLGDTGGVLIHAAAGFGFGTNVANAALTLNIPNGQLAGAYTGSMTVTYLSTGP